MKLGFEDLEADPVGRDARAFTSGFRLGDFAHVELVLEAIYLGSIDGYARRTRYPALSVEFREQDRSGMATVLRCVGLLRSSEGEQGMALFSLRNVSLAFGGPRLLDQVSLANRAAVSGFA